MTQTVFQNTMLFLLLLALTMPAFRTRVEEYYSPRAYRVLAFLLSATGAVCYVLVTTGIMHR